MPPSPIGERGYWDGLRLRCARSRPYPRATHHRRGTCSEIVDLSNASQPTAAGEMARGLVAPESDPVYDPVRRHIDAIVDKVDLAPPWS